MNIREYIWVIICLSHTPNPHHHKHHLGFTWLVGKQGGKKENERKEEEKVVWLKKKKREREKTGVAQ